MFRCAKLVNPLFLYKDVLEEVEGSIKFGLWIERVCSACILKLHFGAFWYVTRTSVLGKKQILGIIFSGEGQQKSLRNEFIYLLFPSSVFLSQTLKNLLDKKRSDIIKKSRNMLCLGKKKKNKGKRYIKEDYKTQLHTGENVIMTKIR